MADPTTAAAAAQPAQETEQEEEIKGRELLAACQAGDEQRVVALLAEGAPSYYQVRVLGGCIYVESVDRLA